METPIDCKFRKVCRTCMSEDGEMSSVFELTASPSNETDVTDFLRRLTSLEFVQGDGLPEKVCSFCVKEIFQAFSFSQKCILSDRKLRLERNRAAFHKIQKEVLEEEQFESNQTNNETGGTQKVSESENSDVEIKHKIEVSDDSNEKLDVITETDIVSNQFKCVECSKIFPKKCQLSVHLKSHIKGNGKFKCTVCGLRFAYLYLLKQHKYKHTEEKPFPCTKCSKGCLTAESLRRHMKIHDANYIKKKYICYICNKEYPYPSFLAEHMKNHTGERPFLCNVCGKSFRQNGSLDYHMRSHTGYKPFKCDVCEKKFKSQGVLNVHMRKHTNERPYVCDVCGMAFKQSTDMRSHKRTHTGDKPVMCSICGKRMSTTGQLTVHIRSHTGEKPFECKTCAKSFATSTMLVKHERIHTGERPYVCNVCEKSFNQSSTLKSHAKTHEGTRRPHRTRRKDKDKEKEEPQQQQQHNQSIIVKVMGENEVVQHVVYIEGGKVDKVMPSPIPLQQL